MMPERNASAAPLSRGWLTMLFMLTLAACGMRSGLNANGAEPTGEGDTPQGAGSGAGGSVAGTRASGGGSPGGVASTGGRVGGTSSGGSPGVASGGVLGGRGGSSVPGNPFGSGGSGGSGRPTGAGGGVAGGATGVAGTSARGGAIGGGATGGSRPDAGTTTGRDASTGPRDALLGPDVLPVGTPVINPNSGYTVLSTGSVVMSGYVSSYVGGSGSSIQLTYDQSSFCASGAVGPSSTYSSWAGAGFNVNQTQSGSSGSTGALPLVGSTISISFKNPGGSRLELQLWDGSNYWCYYLPSSSGATTTTVPLSSLNTACWDGSGQAFTSGTSITTVQLVVPGNATTPAPFDYCFLGLSVK